MLQLTFSFTTSQLKFIKSSPKTSVHAIVLYQFKDTNCVKVSFLSIPLDNFVWVGAKYIHVNPHMDRMMINFVQDEYVPLPITECIEIPS